MTSFKLRPRFKILMEEAPERIVEVFQNRLDTPERDCEGYVIPGDIDHVILKIKKEELHYWSPQLDLSLEETEEGTLLRGLYGPNPNIWTMFMFGYLAIGILALFISIIGFSRVSLGMPAPILWVLPALGIAAFVLYMVGQFGQKLGVEQTFTLHHFVEESINKKIHVH